MCVSGKPKPEPDEYDCKLGVSESDKGIDGTIIDKVTLVSEDGNMDNYEDNLDLCYEKCLAHDDCGGIQVTSNINIFPGPLAFYEKFGGMRCIENNSVVQWFLSKIYITYCQHKLTAVRLKKVLRSDLG